MKRTFTCMTTRDDLLTVALYSDTSEAIVFEVYEGGERGCVNIEIADTLELIDTLLKMTEEVANGKSGVPF